MNLFGRQTIYTAESEITQENLPRVLKDALKIHKENSREIDYLWGYVRGDQPILRRRKKVRPEICNRVVENHATEIAQFTSGYFLGEPMTYVRRGNNEADHNYINVLNDHMHTVGKSSHDKRLSTWMAICGVGYRMILPVNHEEGEAPFAIDTLDPRDTFVVYYSGFGKRRLMSGQRIVQIREKKEVEIYCGYTNTHYYEFEDGVVTKWVAHTLGAVPVYEYRLNMQMMGSFEPALGLLDAMNTIASNRVDGLEQFVQAFLKFKNCKLEEGELDEFIKQGAIMLPPTERGDADVEQITSELNQTQTQTLVDYLYEKVLSICGLPSTTKGGTSTSDTGQAVLLRDGWAQCESRAKDTETLFKETETSFLRLVLRILKDAEPGFSLGLSEVDCKFTRRQHDNLLTKSQSLHQMLECGIEPTIAIATCGLFNDPNDVACASAEYLKKWKYEEIDDAEAEPVPID